MLLADRIVLCWFSLKWREAAIGVLFAAAVAIGAAVTPSENLAESLFGELTRISPIGFLLGMAFPVI